jgi:hypothetical protein
LPAAESINAFPFLFRSAYGNRTFRLSSFRASFEAVSPRSHHSGGALPTETSRQFKVAGQCGIYDAPIVPLTQIYRSARGRSYLI